MIYRVTGARPLIGDVEIGGCKNAVLPILFATLLTSDKNILYGVPDITDVRTTVEILRALGAEVTRPEQDTLVVDTRAAAYAVVDERLVRAIRASTYLIGACLSRFGRVHLQPFGGCAFCTRPIDLHLYATSAFGCKMDEDDIYCKQMVANRLCFSTVSVGATVNALLLASAIPSESILENVAIEPHVMSLITFLRIAGASIRILLYPRPTLFVRGGKLRGVRMRMIPDMIEAGTYLIGGALTGGRVRVLGVDPEHLRALLVEMRRAGAEVETTESTASLYFSRAPSDIRLTCAPYPALPTDLSPILSAFLARFGCGSIADTVFPTRTSFLDVYHALGAEYTLEGGRMTFLRPTSPRATSLTVPDLRTGAGALLLASATEQTTEIHDPSGFVARGYENITQKLENLGAEITVDTSE